MSRIIEFRTKLQTTKNDGMIAIVYIQKFKGLCKALVAIRKLVSHRNHLIYLFQGLDKEYNPFVASMHHRPDNPSVKKIPNQLLSYDFCQDQQYLFGHLNTPQANIAYFPQNKNLFRSF